MKPRHTYTDPDDGQKTPLRDADVDYQVQVFKSHCRKAEIMSPSGCLVAKGAACNKDVHKAHIGSGDEVYLTFYGKGRLGKHTLRYIARTNLKRVRDIFEQRGSPKTQWVTLGAPTPSNSLDAKQTRKQKAAAVKAAATSTKYDEPDEPARGTEQRERVEFMARKGGEKKRRRSREQRIGIKHRPRAITIEDGSWTVPSDQPELDG